jgi:plastocyanin
MLHRFWRPAAVVLLVLALAAVGGTAVAKSKKAPNNATVQAKGKVLTKFKPNGFFLFRDSAHYTPGVVLVRSGGTLTLKNRTTEPHTFSFVAKSDVPKTKKKVENCGAPGTICETLGNAHQIDQNGDPAKPLVDVGTAGFDEPGDSVVLNPKSTQKVDLTAAKGKTLYFICAIHAWMQGVLKVR